MFTIPNASIREIHVEAESFKKRCIGFDGGKLVQKFSYNPWFWTLRLIKLSFPNSTHVLELFACWSRMDLEIEFPNNPKSQRNINISTKTIQKSYLRIIGPSKAWLFWGHIHLRKTASKPSIGGSKNLRAQHLSTSESVRLVFHLFHSQGCRIFISNRLLKTSSAEIPQVGIYPRILFYPKWWLGKNIYIYIYILYV